MANVFIKTLSSKLRCINFTVDANVESLKSLTEQCPHDYYLICNGKIAHPSDPLQADQVYHVVPRLLGGKGGFGSMLRALGAQIEKTTNREACRDLSGRRMRDINNEKQLKEWVEKKAERERDREQKRKERREKRQQFLAGPPKHNFDDPDYDKQKMQVTEQLEDALQQGLQKATAAAGGGKTGRKRRSNDSASATSAKKACEWLGIEDLSDVDTSSSSDTDDSAVPGPSNLSVAPSVASHVPADAADAADTAAAGAPSSDSGVDSEDQVKGKESCGNSPMDVDDGEGKPRPPKEETMQTEGGKAAAAALLADLPVPRAEKEQPVELELEAFGAAAELEALGLDVLKAALTARALKCGGTLRQRAERLWAVRGKQSHEIDPSLFAKGTGKGKGKGKK